MRKRKKRKLNRLSRKIKRLVEENGSVMLEVYRSGTRWDDKGKKQKYVEPYGMRHLKKSGTCSIRYWCRDKESFRGRKRSTCCFMEEYSEYRNEDGDTIVRKSLAGTLRAMENHDGSWVKIKYIYAGDWVYEL